MKRLLMLLLLVITISFLISCSSNSGKVEAYKDGTDFFLKFEWKNNDGIKVIKEYKLSKNINAEYFLFVEKDDNWEIRYVDKNKFYHSFVLLDNQELNNLGGNFSAKKVLSEIQKIYRNSNRPPKFNKDPFQDIENIINVNRNDVFIDIGSIQDGYSYEISYGFISIAGFQAVELSQYKSDFLTIENYFSDQFLNINIKEYMHDTRLIYFSVYIVDRWYKSVLPIGEFLDKRNLKPEDYFYNRIDIEVTATDIFGIAQKKNITLFIRS